ncbi:MAG TPA: hypothetical protein VD962_02260 [Rubricoccaceae bacterium]|nr:hypothetical protein [Rubricoccaceae bacterium]
MCSSLRFLLPVLVLLAACDTVDDGEIGPGDAELTLTGDVDDDFEGDAFYTTFNDNGTPVFALLFFRGDLSDSDRDDYAFAAVSRPGDRPGVGVFTISDEGSNPDLFRGQYADLEDADEPEARGPVLSAREGVLTITRFDNGLLNGSFRFEGRGLDLPDRSTFINATVSGTFEARAVSPDLLRSTGIDFDFD